MSQVFSNFDGAGNAGSVGNAPADATNVSTNNRNSRNVTQYTNNSIWLGNNHNNTSSFIDNLAYQIQNEWWNKYPMAYTNISFEHKTIYNSFPFEYDPELGYIPTKSSSIEIITGTVSVTWNGKTTLMEALIYRYGDETFLKISKYGAYASRVSLVLNITGTFYSGLNIYYDIRDGNPIDPWDVADVGVGTAGAVAGTVLAFGLTSNPIGWTILGTSAAAYGGARLFMLIYEESQK